MSTLDQLHTDIDSRVHLIRDDHADWLCGSGCDGCCHRLADIPVLTFAEWTCLQQGLAELPAAQLQDISRGIAAMTLQTARPLICPMLDRAAGLCRVYAQRPVACRTYGFYVQRDQGLYCNDIKSRVDGGAWADVIWGNQDVIDRRLADLGDTKELTEWFTAWICTVSL